MVRTLTPDQQTARDANNHRFMHLAKIFWPSGMQICADRGVGEIDPDSGLTIVPIITGFPHHTRVANFDIDGGGGPAMRADLVLSIDTSDLHNVGERVKNDEVMGMLVETYVVMKPASGTLDESDWILLGRWSVDASPTINNPSQTVRLSMVDTLQLVGERNVCRVVSQGLLPAAPEKSVGKILPQVFGVVNVEGILITGGHRGTLDGDIEPYKGVITLNESITDWPTSGLILIGSEAIQYTSVDTGSKTIGTAADPVTRGWVTIPDKHDDGDVVIRRRPTTDKYRFVFGDKQTGATVSTLENNDEVLDSSLWADSDETVAGETSLIVDLDEFPSKFVDTGRVRTVVLHELREVREISDATNADPIVITCPNGHNFVGGNAIFLDGVEGNTSANGRRKVKASSPTPTATTFAITDMDDATVAGIGAYTQGGSVHPQVLEFTEFTGSPANSAADWENVIDLSPERETTYADLTQGVRVSITPAVDLLSIFQDNPDHPYLGRLIGVRAFVEYQAVVGPTSGTWPPSNTPILEVVWSSLTSAGHILPEPEDLGEDADLFLEGDDTSDSTDLFTLHTAGPGSGEGTLETERTYALLFKEIDTAVSDASHGTTDPPDPPGQIDFDYWPGYSALSNGYPIWSIYSDGLITDLISATITGDVSENPDDGTIQHAKLVFRPANDGSIPANVHITKLVARVWVLGNTGNGIDALPRVTINVNGGAAIGVSPSSPTGNDEYVLVVASVTGEFDKTDILATDIEIEGEPLNLTAKPAPASDETNKWKFWVTQVELVSWDKPEFEGETTPLTGHVSKRMRFTHDITSQILDTGGWESFLSSGTGQIRISVNYPAQSNDMELRIYRLGFEVDVADQEVHLATEDNSRITGTVTGYGGATNNAQDTIEEIITGSSYMAKTTQDYDQAGLITALSDLVIDPWLMNRALIEQIRLKDLLASAVRDSGIRSAPDSGRLVFFDRIGNRNVSADSVRTINRSLRIGDAPNISKTHPDLVVNDLTILYDRNSFGEFVQGGTDVNPFSISLPWGRQAHTIKSDWITAGAQISELLARMLADFSLAHQLVPIIADGGKTIDLEVGDVVEIDDDLNFLDSPATLILGGTIMGATLSPGSDQHSLTIAVSDLVTTVEGSGNDRIDSGTRPARTEFYIGGNLVAVLMYSGIYIKGEIIEETGSGTTTHTGPVDFSSNTWRFSVDIGAGSTIRMTLDANGDLTLKNSYIFVEQLQYPLVDLGSSDFDADGTVLAFHPGDRTLRMAALDSAGNQFVVRQITEGAFE